MNYGVFSNQKYNTISNQINGKFSFLKDVENDVVDKEFYVSKKDLKSGNMKKGVY